MKFTFDKTAFYENDRNINGKIADLANIRGNYHDKRFGFRALSRDRKLELLAEHSMMNHVSYSGEGIQNVIKALKEDLDLAFDVAKTLSFHMGSDNSVCYTLILVDLADMLSYTNIHGSLLYEDDYEQEEFISVGTLVSKATTISLSADKRFGYLKYAKHYLHDVYVWRWGILGINTNECYDYYHDRQWYKLPHYHTDKKQFLSWLMMQLLEKNPQGSEGYKLAKEYIKAISKHLSSTPEQITLF